MKKSSETCISTFRVVLILGFFIPYKYIDGLAHQKQSHFFSKVLQKAFHSKKHFIFILKTIVFIFLVFIVLQLICHYKN